VTGRTALPYRGARVDTQAGVRLDGRLFRRQGGDFEFAGQIAQFDPTVLDRLDTDKALDLAQEINGAPRAIFRRDEEVALIRRAREQQALEQTVLAAADQLAETANKAIPALEKTRDFLDKRGAKDADRAETGEAGGTAAEPGLPEPV